MNRSILSALTCFVTLSFVACTTTIPTPSPTADNPSWTAKSLPGLRMTLIDRDRVEYMSFFSDGSLAITIGRKKGSIAAPVFKWRLVSGRLHIADYDNMFYEELTLISRNASRIVARRRNGEVATYKIH